MITQNPCRHVGYFLFFKKYFLQNMLWTHRCFVKSKYNRINYWDY